MLVVRRVAVDAGRYLVRVLLAATSDGVLVLEMVMTISSSLMRDLGGEFETGR